MSPLPLLKLPLLVQKAIVQQWDLNTIFSFSILSEKAKNHLKECNLKVDKFSLFIHEAFAAELSSIHLEGLQDSLDIDIANGSYLRVENLVMNKNLKPTSTRKYKQTTSDSLMKLLEKPTKHLLSFFKVRKIQLQFGGDIGLINFFLWKYAAKFDSITIGINGINNCAQPAHLTPDELKFVLEDVTTDYLELNVVIKDNSYFKYPTATALKKPLKVRRIKIHNNHHWIDFDKLVLMDFVSIDSNFRSGTVQQLNSILKSWISGTNDKLEEFKLNTYDFLVRQPYRIFKGIKATPTVFTDQELGNRYSNLEGAIKNDIKGDRNGRQATVILSGKHFVILVWNKEKLKEIGRL